MQTNAHNANTHNANTHTHFAQQHLAARVRHHGLDAGSGGSQLLKTVAGKSVCVCVCWGGWGGWVGGGGGIPCGTWMHAHARPATAAAAAAGIG